MAHPVDGVADVRRDDVGGPLLAAVQRVARGPADPRSRARAVPERRAPLLVAGRRARSGALADEPPGPDRLPVHPDDPEHVPGGRHPQRDRALYPHYATLVRPWGIDRPRRPAPRRRDHVDRRRRRLPDRDHGGRRGLDAGRGARRGPCRSPGRCRAGRDPDPRATTRRATRRRQTRARAGGVAPTAHPAEPSALRRDRRDEVLAIPLRVHVPAADDGHDRPVEPDPARASRAWNAIAAMPSAPDGSTTSRLRSAASRTAAAISSSETVTIESRWARRWANVRSPSACVRVPSAIVRDTSSAGQRTISPRASESRASAASSGSTPMTRAVRAERLDRRRRSRWPARRHRSGRGRPRRPAGPRRSRARPCPGRR